MADNPKYPRPNETHYDYSTEPPTVTVTPMSDADYTIWVANCADYTATP